MRTYMSTKNSFQCLAPLQNGGETGRIYSLKALKSQGFGSVDRLPFSLKILLENLLRHEDGLRVRREDIEALARWAPGKPSQREISFTPARVLLQDFTGVPCAVDLASLRDWLTIQKGNPKKANPLKPVDLVIDHSVQVDSFGERTSFEFNVEKEFARNRERYAFLRWAQNSFTGFRVVPPGTGIVHQVNLEYLAQVVFIEPGEDPLVYPDTLLGTDSHTTMINGLGVLGWGVGGIEAEAAMLGQPVSMLIPDVVGMELTGALMEGATATDLVLTVTQILRKAGVIGKFVEFFGSGLSSLALPDRATVANMAPEYGATMGFFPVDMETLAYLKQTGRPERLIRWVESYAKEQGMFRTDSTPDPYFSQVIELDLGQVEPSLAGPRRPQDRLPLSQVKDSFSRDLPTFLDSGSKKKGGPGEEEGLGLDGVGTSSPVRTSVLEKTGLDLRHGSVVVAAITSCTNTSNPQVMLQAGLLAKKAVERGLKTKPWVKTSLAPGSRVVMDYLQNAGVLEFLEKLGFYLVGFGCTTCIGNSGPLPEPVAKSVKENNLVVASVLSGNRNFEGRIQPLVKANYLASPPLVVAYALAGSVNVDLLHEPVGEDSEGHPVFLKEIWPSQQEVREAARRFVTGDLFQSRYAHVFEGDKNWNSIPVLGGERFKWEGSSTYIRKAPFFEGLAPSPAPVMTIRQARVLALLGDSITTDHISPAGAIPSDSPAGRYLAEQGVSPGDFNSYGSRRGNHEVMVRGTLANIRLKNELAPGTEGGWTRHFPDGKVKTIYEASCAYRKEGVPLVILAGKEYGSGSSRDWAAKGVQLLGVRAVIAESFERIHRSNLVGMGVLPLEFKPGESGRSLGLTGAEFYTISESAVEFRPGQRVSVSAETDGNIKTFETIVRIDTPGEWDYYRHGGILPCVARQLLGS
jgi:aconitate hydratase